MVLTVLYFTVAVLVVWPMAQLAMREFVGEPWGRADAFDRGMSVFTGSFAAAFWPLIVACWIGWRVSRAIWTRVLDLNPDDERARSKT